MISLVVVALIVAAAAPPARQRLVPSALILHTDITIPRDAQRFPITAPEEGVRFDMNADGVPEQTAWTAPGSRLAFLAIDRNGNGAIDNGTELIGAATRQGAGSGIDALSDMLDAAGAAVSGSSQAGDPLYDKLLLWEDRNHNGISEAGELRPVRELYTRIGLGARIVRTPLDHGNVLYFEGWAEIRAEGQTRTRKMLEIGFAPVQK